MGLCYLGPCMFKVCAVAVLRAYCDPWCCKLRPLRPCCSGGHRDQPPLRRPPGRERALDCLQVPMQHAALCMQLCAQCRWSPQLGPSALAQCVGRPQVCMPRKESWLPLYQGSAVPSLLHASSCACRDDVDHRGRKIDWGKWCVEGWASRPCAWRGRPAGRCTHLAALQWSPRCSKHARQHPACVCCAAASAAVGARDPQLQFLKGSFQCAGCVLGPGTQPSRGYHLQ